MDRAWQILTGQQHDTLLPVVAGSHLCLHAEVMPHWQALVAQADKAGFALRIASGWRGFERQRLIWNGKASGERPVLDDAGVPVDISTLNEDALLFAILRWSAIPGCSRHHWGTDLDVYDAAAVPPDYRVQLTMDECCGTGPFAPLHTWLGERLLQSDAVFFRPYARDSGGIAPEPWHLSCRPVAAQFDARLQPEPLLDWLMVQDIALRPVIARHWTHIFHRYVKIADRTAADLPGVQHVE